MSHPAARPSRLDRPVDPLRDHILGNATADMTLLEFGSYDCPYCHAAHEVIGELRDKFGDRMRYVFRHRPITNSATATKAADVIVRAFQRFCRKIRKGFPARGCSKELRRVMAR